MVERPEQMALVVQRLGDEVKRLSIQNAYLQAQRLTDLALIQSLQQELAAQKMPPAEVVAATTLPADRPRIALFEPAHVSTRETITAAP